MLTHLVLFNPRPDLPAADAERLLAALEHAAREIPQVRRFEVGRQTASPPGYAASAAAAYRYVAMVWLDDRDALDAYLAHPAHQALGAAFNATVGGALIYDLEMEDVAGGGARRLLDRRAG
jgi:hypothetical protein